MTFNLARRSVGSSVGWLFGRSIGCSGGVGHYVVSTHVVQQPARSHSAAVRKLTENLVTYRGH